jgi:hypothetical protein
LELEIRTVSVTAHKRIGFCIEVVDLRCSNDANHGAPQNIVARNIDAFALPTFKGHFTYEPRAVTMKLREPNRM